MTGSTTAVVRQMFDPSLPPALLRQRESELERRVARIKRERERTREMLKSWQDWVPNTFPQYAVYSFAEHHTEFWDWVWAIEKKKRPQPFVGIWPRGGGKSSSAEMAAVAVAARRVRRYIWYCCETQEQADQHVTTIADMLESNIIEKNHPTLAERELGKYGAAKAWRRNRLRTPSMTIDAIGLDTARRGARVKEDRPDMMIFDDIDSKHDSPRTINKKKEVITTSLLPAGSVDLAVLMMQNLIHVDSVFSQLVDGRAAFLFDKRISGPHPAVIDLTYEEKPEGGYEVTGGIPIWEGQDLKIVEGQINDWGPSAFEHESQQEVDVQPGGVWDHITFRHCDLEDVPELIRGAVWVDPAVTNTDQSDSHAIQADGLGIDNKIYRFHSWEQVTSPEDSIRRAVFTALRYKFETVGVETDQGGDAWRSVYRLACQHVQQCAVMLVKRKKLVSVRDEQVGTPEYKAEAVSGIAEIDDALKGDDYRKIVGAVSQLADEIVNGRLRLPAFKQAKAGAGHGSKVHRNSLMLNDYESGNVIHVRGTTGSLEKALRRFPLTKPFDLVDASYWSWNDLKGASKGIFF